MRISEAKQCIIELYKNTDSVIALVTEPFNWTPVLFGLGCIVGVGAVATAIVFFLRRRRAAFEEASEVEDIPKKRMRIPNMLNEAEDDNEQD